ncbi:agglutinin-like isoform X2 [Carex rostrata]
MSTSSIIKKGTFSGDDMQEKEMDPTGATRIVKITINHNNGWIVGLTVYFERNGIAQCTNRWGGSYGELTVVNLKTNEYITSVNGYVSSYGDNVCIVRSLKLKTNLDGYGPFGWETGESFEFPAPLGGEIIGFHGYCRKDWVNALGVYVRQLNGTIIKKGPFHSRGAIVKHMDPTGITRIVKISIYHSDKIDALIVYFECNGITQYTDRWGGDGGNLTEINLKTKEYIKSVKGKYQSSKLKSLVLETNLAVYGPYGKEEGESFEYTSPLHGQIIGFFAKVNVNYILRVGVYVDQAFISESVPCGGSGGLPIKTYQIKSVVSRIVKVNIRHGDTIDALCVCYKLRDDTTESTPLWGGETGGLTKIEFEEDEYIKSVRGYVGYFGDLFIVRSLQLITNKKTHGPYGKEEGTPFELDELGGTIIGFHGRSGAYLDAIGVYVQWPIYIS